MSNKIIDWLSKLGILRFGGTAATYRSAVDRPLELQEPGVFNSGRDLIGERLAPPPGDEAPGGLRDDASRRRATALHYVMLLVTAIAALLIVLWFARFAWGAPEKSQLRGNTNFTAGRIDADRRGRFRARVAEMTVAEGRPGWGF